MKRKIVRNNELVVGAHDAGMTLQYNVVNKIVLSIRYYFI